MDREHLIVEVLVDKAIVADGELRAHDDGQQTGHQEEEKRNADIDETDHRIVDGRNQPPTAWRRPDALQFADLSFGAGIGIGEFHHPPPPLTSRRK
ncbi:hypothetical protein [Sinorhizobium medicae]|uniref:hypothetical protein n=1 Tax=Sinorhizobium medicae TaxID=110321 RepID=UPI003C724CEB